MAQHSVRAGLTGLALAAAASVAASLGVPVGGSAVGAATVVTNPSPTTTLPRPGTSCVARDIGRRIGNLVCQRVNGQRRWVRASVPSSVPPSVSSSALPPAPSGPGSAAQASTSTAVPGSPSSSSLPSSTSLPSSSTTVVSGPAITAGFDGRTITVGNLGTLAHPVWGPAGRAVTDGVHAYIDDYNARGGVASRYKVAIVDQDTSYDPATAMQLFAQSKDKVALFASMFGTPIVTSVLPLLQQNQMAAVPASGDAEWTLKGNLVPTGGVLQVHAINGIVWFYEQAGNATKRMCSLYVDSSYGKAGQEGVEFAARFLNRAFGPSIALGLTDTQLLGPSIQFRANGCDAIVVTGTPSQATALLLQSSQLGYTPQLILVGPTYNDAQVVPANSELYGRYAVVSSDGVNWGDTSVKGMADLTAAIRRHAKQYVDRPELAFLQGWMQARTAMAVLEKAVELGDLSRPGVLRAIGQVGKVGFDGLVSAEWDYVDPSKRTVPPANAIFAVDPSYPLGLRLIQKGYTSNAAKAYRP